ncbi:MAG: hypothetical protein V4819_03945 [Verrucomicrobiota bacterium]
MNEKSGNFELLEPVSPESLIPDSWVEPWMIAALVLLAITLLAVVILRKKKTPMVDPIAVRKAAHAEAAAALDRIGVVPAREAAVQSSLILRRYLSVVAGDPALFETHEEYISRHDALKNFSEEARGSTSIGFARLAAMKYGPETPAMTTDEVIAGSRALLEILHHGIRA